jgi:hypothetical protein
MSDWAEGYVGDVDEVVDEPVEEPPETAVSRTIEELGIPEALVQDLVIRSVLVAGRTSTIRLSRRLKLNPALVTSVLEMLRDRQLVEVQAIQGHDLIVALTEAGRRTAEERLTQSRYTGPAPVALADYTTVVLRQHASPLFNLSQLRTVFADLVIADSLLSEVGPAAMGGGAMFLYGPPGTGKTSIAERLGRVYDDLVLVPYAVEVDNQIITVFDPVVHNALDDQPDEVDDRWVLCERPFISVGGELTGSMLDLAHQEAGGTYLAPLQMQANNGILVIDDFGRQTLSPEALLNRWIVPLDRAIDYLSLSYGQKFAVPFDSKIVFSTNLEPEDLGDEAFFRRIQSKVLVPAIRDSQFEEVLLRVSERMGIELTADAPTHLRWMSRELGDGDLRPYLPGAVCEILQSVCAFEDRPLLLDPPMIERIAKMYFTRATDGTEDEIVAPSESMLDDMMPSASGEKTSMFSASAEKDESEAKPAERNWAAAAAKALADETADDDDIDADPSEESVGV